MNAENSQYIVSCHNFLVHTASMQYNSKMASESDILLNIGLAVKAKRLELGYTQKQLATKSNVHVNSLSALENGKLNATISLLILISNALDTDFYELIKTPNKN